MPPALTERFQVLRGRLAPCGCTWPWWLDGSFGLPFHEIFVALGSLPAREKWPSTAGQRNRSLERQNALHSVRFCITNLLVKPETDPVVNNAMHACFGSEKFQPKKRKLWQNKKTSWKCRTLVHFFCLKLPSDASLRGDPRASRGRTGPAASGRCGAAANSLSATATSCGCKVNGWLDAMMLSKVREVHGSPIVRSDSMQ